MAVRPCSRCGKNESANRKGKPGCCVECIDAIYRALKVDPEGTFVSPGAPRKYRCQTCGRPGAIMYKEIQSRSIELCNWCVCRRMYEDGLARDPEHWLMDQSDVARMVREAGFEVVDGAGRTLPERVKWSAVSGKFGGWIHVNRQVRLVGTKPVFALPKRNKIRSVPLPAQLAATLKAHMKEFPPVAVTLPWAKPDGDPKTFRLLFVDAKGRAYNRSVFNMGDWKRALAAAGVIPPRERGARYLQAAPEDGMHALRHAYASVLLDAGESIKALSEYLGHSDPGSTLRTYTHLLPSSETRTRKAIDDAFTEANAEDRGSTSDGEGASVPTPQPTCQRCALAA